MLNDKNISCIPSIIHDNKFVTDFSKKFGLFNSFFAKQCLIIENNSVLPSSTNSITDQYLANIQFTKDDLKRIICKLDPNKAHGQYWHAENVWRRYNWISFNNIQKLLKMWHISGWLDKRYHLYLKKAINKTSNIVKNIVESLFFQSAARFSNVSYMITC